MKRLIAFVLCLVLTLSLPGVAGAEDVTADTAAAEVQQAIEGLGTMTRDSKSALDAVNQKINDFVYTYGNYQKKLITNLADFETAVAAYNDLIDYLCGDINADEAINAKDALEVLKAAVGKVTFTEKEGYAADVNNDGEFNAKDALMILQFSVGKRTEFPGQLQLGAYETESALYSKKSEELYDTTYQSMIDRIRENGYAQTSITGTYNGMFCRDSSIQILAHITEGDYDQARALLNYIVEFHKKNNLNYAVHIIYEGGNYSAKQQIDGTFFFLHAWYQFATQAPQTAQNKAFIEGSYSKVKDFANFYLDQGCLHSNYDLIFNPSLEHSRENDYWQAYDLLTNVYVSQGLHEMALYFKTSDPTNAQKWEDAASRIVKGVHNNLVAEVDGKIMYAELRGRSEKKVAADPDTPEVFVSGFSWVNLAPMSCDWYAADPDIMDHTYQMYLKYAAPRFANRTTKTAYKIFEQCTDYYRTKTVDRAGSLVIGKGIAWEILYCAKMKDTERLTTLLSFVEENSNEIYPELWSYSGDINDGGNQEQASWLLIAHNKVINELGRTVK